MSQRTFNEKLGRAINRAAEELPEKWILNIYVEKGAAWVDLWDEKGETRTVECNGNFIDQIEECIDLAIEESA